MQVTVLYGKSLGWELKFFGVFSGSGGGRAGLGGSGNANLRAEINLFTYPVGMAVLSA
jgi:hypothetical protein